MFKPFMKYLWASTTIASAALASNIFIASPSVFTNVLAGSQITIRLGHKDPLGESTVAIGIQQCKSDSDCMGTNVYSAPYTPVKHDDADYPYQSVTFTLPSWPNGPVELDVACISLVDTGQFDTVEYTNTTLNIVSQN